MLSNKTEILYHGTASAHDGIDLSRCGSYKDFGRGYYLTSSRKQAEEWAKSRGGVRGVCWVYEYLVDGDTEKTAGVRELQLLKYDEEWLTIITYCRLLDEVPSAARQRVRNPANYDVVYDRMADNRYDRLTDLLNGYYRRDLSAKYVLDRIPFRSDLKDCADQYCFKTEAAIRLLRRGRVWSGKRRTRNTPWIFVQEGIGG